MINLDKIKNWDKIKGKSVWVNANFQELKEKKSDHFSFSFKTTNLGDLLCFSLYLIDSDNNKITFSGKDKKIAH